MQSTETIERLRALGSARKNAAAAIKSMEEWTQVMANRPTFPSDLGPCWQQIVEYVVDDIDAEIGFYIEVLGLTPMIMQQDHAMFCFPPGDGMCVMVRSSTADMPATQSFALELMVQKLDDFVQAVQDRGATFEKQPEPEMPGSPLSQGLLRTPNGVPYRIWCFAPESQPGEEPAAEEPAPAVEA